MPNPLETLASRGSGVLDRTVAAATTPIDRATGQLGRAATAYQYGVDRISGTARTLGDRLSTMQRRLAALGIPANQTGGARADPPSLFLVAGGRPDPLLNLDWDVMIQIKGINVDISSYVEEVALPSIRIENKPVFRQGTQEFYAKTETPGSLTLKLYETASLDSYRFFRAWKNLVRTPNGDYGLPSEYKGRILLYPLAADRSRIAVFEARGCFPISLPTQTYSSGQPDRIINDVEMSCDELVPLAVT